MSTFTNWNGPQGAGGGSIRTADLLALTKAYQEVLERFEEYQKKLNWDPEPTAGSNNSLTSGTIQAALSDIISKFNSYYDKVTADSTFVTKTAFSTKITEKDQELRAILQDYVLDSAMTEALSKYIKTSDLDANAVIVAIKSDITALNSAIAYRMSHEHEDDTWTWPKLVATDYVKGMLNALHELWFDDKEFSAHIGGSDETGVFYILGMVDEDKAGTAYIRYTNGHPFAAEVNFVVRKTGTDTDGNGVYKGALTVLTNASLDGLKFMLVKGTHENSDTSEKTEHIYLAAQAINWIPKFDSTDGVGSFPYIKFKASGINFAPVGSARYIAYNSECSKIAECTGNSEFNANNAFLKNISVTELKSDSIVDNDGDPIIHIDRDTKEDSDGSPLKALVIGGEADDVIMFYKHPEAPYKIVDEETGEEKVVLSPYITLKDMELALLPIGSIIRWGKYHEEQEPVLDEEDNPVINMDGYPNPLQEDGEEAYLTKYVLENIPDGFHACDGSPFDTDELIALGELYPDGVLPVEDFSIIKVKELLVTEVSPKDVPTALDFKYLDKKVDIETKRATDAEKDLQDNIDAEAARATQAETDLQANIDKEIEDRTQADIDLEKRLQDNIDAEAARATQAETDLDTKINDETARATQAEADLDTKINDETARATQAEADLDTKINDETVRATQAEADLDTKIGDETARATQAEKDLQDNIDTVADDLAAEVTDRTDADTDLQALIEQVNKQSIQIFTGTVANLPTQTPVPVTGAIIANGQNALLNTNGTLRLYVASVTGSSVTWTPV